MATNMGKFEEYFQRADLDRDGRISGAEAVSFLQGSNLPRPILAQIWMHADQNRTGFLSRPEFYNALKLVTVAQSKRELTPDIVKAALYGPASAKIPAPQIGTTSTPMPSPNPGAVSPSPQTGATATSQPIQNVGFRGSSPVVTSVNQQFGGFPSSLGLKQQFVPTPPSSGMNQNFGPAPLSSGMNQQFAQMRPPSTMNPQFGQVQPTNIIMNQQFGQFPGPGTTQQFRQAPPSADINQQFFPSQGATSHPSQLAGTPNNSRGMITPGQSNDWLGGKTGAVSTGPATQNLDRGGSPSPSNLAVAPNPLDALSNFSSTAVKDAKGSISSGSLSTSSAVVPVTSSHQPLVKPDPFEAFQSPVTKPSNVTQAAQAPPLPKNNQQTPGPAVSSGVQPSVGNSTSDQSQISWPKMMRASIQKYAKVFMEVDNDRDGKITGDQARNLFLSWRLPREVLRQVWDLSDQDSDSMLSLREFCIALYLMEQYREGRPLPPELPNSVMLDETLLSLAGPPTAYGNIGWGPATGLRPQQALSGAQTVASAGFRSTVPSMDPRSDGQFNQKSVMSLNNSLVNQPSNGEANSLDTKDLNPEELKEKVDDKEKVLLDSREKLEFYRTKMQDLVLYKSRCDNRLNEITERAKADKTEAELLEKKYQEKYKQVAEIHSKLTIEEASFREIQGRKTELQQAILKMEQGGSVDGLLQVRADRMQSDLEELLKALTARCQKLSVEIKSSASIELPTGWHTGIPEVAALWDEDWDKFDDEGFSFDATVPPIAKSDSRQDENSLPVSPDSRSNAATSEKLFDPDVNASDGESVNGADDLKSPRESLERKTSPESRSHEYSENHFRRSPDGDAETERSFGEPNWGNFNKDDDIDSVWGFNAKDSDHVKHEQNFFFGSKDFVSSPDGRDSPNEDSTFPKKSSFFDDSVAGSPPRAGKNDPFNFFDDSVPATPLSRAGNSPRYSVDTKDPFFHSFSGYDSFSSSHDPGFSSHPENLTRFDSINSTKGFDHSSKFSFDDSDPFGSTGPFKVSSETPKKGSEEQSSF